VDPVAGAVPVPETAIASELVELLTTVSVAELAPVAWGANRTPIVQLALGSTGATHPLMIR
jgi:hypothetical protein